MTKKIKQQLQLQQQTQQIQDQPPDLPFDPLRPSVSAEEIDLFDRIKKHIGSKPSYDEFLKIINLYTLHILNADQLIQQVEPFLDQDTLNSLQQLIEYEPKDKSLEIPHYPPVKPDLNDCETVDDSPSYRIVPKEVLV
jgi:paired amphipathic helix protein Sin3a